MTSEKTDMINLAVSEAIVRAEEWIAALCEELETMARKRRVARLDREEYGYTAITAPSYAVYLQLEADIREARRFSNDVYCEIIRNHLA